MESPALPALGEICAPQGREALGYAARAASHSGLWAVGIWLRLTGERAIV